jgi:ribosomal protein S18 acetylase RimI-like enzyme
MDERLLAAIHENRLIATERVGHLSERSRLERKGPWLLIDTGEPEFAAANSATPVTPVGEADLAIAIDWFAARSAAFHFVVRSTTDAALLGLLKDRGYSDSPSERALDLDSPRPPAYEGPLSIREVLTDQEIDIYGGINWPSDLRHVGVAIAHTAARLGFILLLGEVGGRPVACSMAVVSGSIVGLYNVAVTEAYRRRGFGTAITWAAVEAGVRRGATTAWLGSTELAYSMYCRMGFHLQFDYLHMRPPN